MIIYWHPKLNIVIAVTSKGSFTIDKIDYENKFGPFGPL
jgi:hypothetical protein